MIAAGILPTPRDAGRSGNAAKRRRIRRDAKSGINAAKCQVFLSFMLSARMDT